ncbi:transcription initiation factor TFIID subunit 11 [Nematocida minor]|uniref:transcription initiation factor TFIID subunit 11 n=1 Tax=Nematocida minor TaxID=1912983 RepID=UPI00221E3DCA|nr:transcription initiation factor TFIID subunit 11 [Nematocida minor]KAI5190018.1 transcription initiation factor TFIID subunit 11 [Nematocida minor]
MREDEGDPMDTESEEIEVYKEPAAAEMVDLTEDELMRYVKFRRTGFNKGGIRKFVSQVLEQTCNPNFSIVLSGIAKVFVSEMVEEAKEVQEQWGDAEELLPSHIHEAYRRLCKKLPNMN